MSYAIDPPNIIARLLQFLVILASKAQVRERVLLALIAFRFSRSASNIFVALPPPNRSHALSFTTAYLSKEPIGPYNMASSLSSRLSQLSTHLPAVKPTGLPISLVRFPPSSEPTTLPPPPDFAALAHPFSIPVGVYNALLSPSVPITVALVYASVVTYMNNVNAQRKWKPWAFSQTSTFKTLVILHNVILAIYSAWTLVGMVNALAQSLPGWGAEHGLAQIVDSLCKIQGPRGLGSAAIFNEQTSAWSMTNRAFHLAADGLAPERTDVGRIWNEGLAFYGWLFYLSKFYEVIDTAIILAKGKKSSFLQTYHHAGAMLCMWAGIRYMSPPIWMFVLVNSGVHAIMYTFYLCSALNIQVPKTVKQVLTTTQIAQFVIGASYAFAHLFVAYQIPVTVPYMYHLGDAISTVSSAFPSDMSSASSAALTTASAGVGSFLKKAVLRAAGREGLAENVRNERGQTFGVDVANAAKDFMRREETRFRDELQWEHCLDTSGQVFAILLNCMYLAPLTWLFVRFFIEAYTKRMERRRSSTASEKAIAARHSLTDASKGFERQVREMVADMHNHEDAVTTTEQHGGTSSQTESKSESKSESKVETSSESKPEEQRDLKTFATNSSEAAWQVKEELAQKAADGVQSAKDVMTMLVDKAADAQQGIQDSLIPTKETGNTGSGSVDNPEQMTSTHGEPSSSPSEDAEQDTKEVSNEIEKSEDTPYTGESDESRKRFAAAQEALEQLMRDAGGDELGDGETPEPEDSPDPQRDPTSMSDDDQENIDEDEAEDLSEISLSGISREGKEHPSTIAESPTPVGDGTSLEEARAQQQAQDKDEAEGPVQAQSGARESANIESKEEHTASDVQDTETESNAEVSGSSTDASQIAGETPPESAEQQTSIPQTSQIFGLDGVDERPSTADPEKDTSSHSGKGGLTSLEAGTRSPPVRAGESTVSTELHNRSSEAIAAQRADTDQVDDLGLSSNEPRKNEATYDSHTTTDPTLDVGQEEDTKATEKNSAGSSASPTDRSGAGGVSEDKAHDREEPGVVEASRITDMEPTQEAEQAPSSTSDREDITSKEEAMPATDAAAESVDTSTESEQQERSISASTEDRSEAPPSIPPRSPRRKQTPSVKSKASSLSVRSSRSHLDQMSEELQAKNGDSPRHSSGSLVQTATA